MILMTVILLSVCFIKTCTNPVLLTLVSFNRSIVESLNSLELITSPSSCLVAFWQLIINEYEWMKWGITKLLMPNNGNSVSTVNRIKQSQYNKYQTVANKILLMKDRLWRQSIHVGKILLILLSPRRRRLSEHDSKQDIILWWRYWISLIIHSNRSTEQHVMRSCVVMKLGL